MTLKQSRSRRPLIASLIIVAGFAFAAIAMSLSPPASQQQASASRQADTSLAGLVGRPMLIMHTEPNGKDLRSDNGTLEHADEHWIAFRQPKGGFTVWVPRGQVYRIEVIH